MSKALKVKLRDENKDFERHKMRIWASRQGRSQVEKKNCDLSKSFGCFLNSPGSGDMLPSAPRPWKKRVGESACRQAEEPKGSNPICDGSIPKQGSWAENGRGSSSQGRKPIKV